ncbi:MAG TPA: hypothetical protein VGP51_00585 [Nocardioidaceae bacterium]|nr:hypothetical protein [Nocardioidaceae bacterium]
MNLDDELLRQLKQRATERGTTVTALVAEAVRASLVEPAARRAFELDMPTVRGERNPLIDPADRSAVHDLLDAAEPSSRS